MESVGFTQGFLLGILASGIAWRFSESIVQPSLEIVVDPMRAQGQSPSNQPHEFYHVQVRNIPHNRHWPSRRPAWAVRARLTFSMRMRPVLSLVTFRLVGLRNQNLCSPFIAQGRAGNLQDPARIMQARKIDVHGHFDESMSIVVKFEGEPDCYIFTNESHYFPKWQNPAWRLAPGRYRVRVTVYNEQGSEKKDFELRNDGPSRETHHVCLRAWPTP